MTKNLPADTSTSLHKINYLNHIRNFRGIAIFYIVAGHCLSAFNWDDNEVFGRIARMVLGNGTVFFVFIAGYLFQHLSYKYQPKKYLLSKFNYVLVPYFLLSIPAIIYFTVFQEREDVWAGFYENPTYLQIIYFYLTGLHLTQFWFIPMISVFYLMSPALIAFDRLKGAYFLLPALVVLSCYVPRGDVLQCTVHFFSVYILGMCFSRYKDKIDSKIATYPYLCFFVGLYLSMIAMEFYLMTDNSLPFLNFLRKLLLSCAFMAILLKVDFNSKILSLLAEISFGIFFVHTYYIEAFKKYEEQFIGYRLEGNSLYLLIFIGLILLLSSASILLVKKLFAKKSRYLVGC